MMAYGGRKSRTRRSLQGEFGEDIVRVQPRSALLPALLLAGLAAMSTSPARSHGDVQPQPFDTTGLEVLGVEWRETNPYSGNELAVALGSSGYNQNCARCHGLGLISGGLAPDLRFLEKGKEGDEVFQTRVRHGVQFQGMTKMPVFDGVLSQEALWAIRSYIESKHEE